MKQYNFSAIIGDMEEAAAEVEGLPNKLTKKQVAELEDVRHAAFQLAREAEVAIEASEGA